MNCENKDCPVCNNPIYEKEYIDFLINHIDKTKANIFIDVGSHVGLYCIKLAEYMDYMVAIEADTANFKYLPKLGNLECIPSACSDKVGLLNYFGSGVMGYTSNKEGGVSVQSITLDSLNLTGNWNIFLKIDVEGAELKVLQGAEKLFENFKKIYMVIEHHKSQDKHHNQSRELILDFLKQKGFTVQHGHANQIKIKAVKK